MDTCLLSTSPIIPHSIASSIKSQTPPPHPQTLQLLRKPQSVSVITIKHAPFALPHAARATALTFITPSISCLSSADFFSPRIQIRWPSLARLLHWVTTVLAAREDRTLLVTEDSGVYLSSTNYTGRHAARMANLNPNMGGNGLLCDESSHYVKN